ncbi:hypothetical protein MKX03_011180, partial [Papaver bracteatum]
MFQSIHTERVKQSDSGKHYVNNAKRQVDLRLSPGVVIWQPWVMNSHYEDEEVVLSRELSVKIIYFRGVVDTKDEVLYLGERCLRQVLGIISILCPPPDFLITRTEDIREGVHYSIADDTEFVGWWKTISMGPLFPYLSHVQNHEEVGIGNIGSSRFVPNVPAP